MDLPEVPTAACAIVIRKEGKEIARLNHTVAVEEESLSSKDPEPRIPGTEIKPPQLDKEGDKAMVYRAAVALSKDVVWIFGDDDKLMRRYGLTAHLALRPRPCLLFTDGTDADHSNALSLLFVSGRNG